MHDLEILLTHLSGKLLMEVEKAEHPINEVRDHEVTVGMLTVCMK
jgi:hypothetical protein